jgi:threonylcarbamoyladenosine tRNA methylthiotransferase MtaB
VVLTGINIGDFDGDAPGVKLSDLVRAVDKLSGLKRLRLSSIDPDEVDDDLADAILKGRTTCPSMHIVLQSGSNVILKKMNRKYTRQIFLETAERLRRARPDFTFTTDVIVGFPGETEADFEETLGVIREVKFAKVHMFPFSPRPRTRAATYPGRVSQQEVKRRKQKVLRLSEQAAYELREPYVSRVMTVLTEGGDASIPGGISGHTDNFLTVFLEDCGIGPNELVDVEILKNTAKGLLGKAAVPPARKHCCG